MVNLVYTYLTRIQFDVLKPLGRGGGVTDACAVCKILHVIECAWGSSGFKLPTV